LQVEFCDDFDGGAGFGLLRFWGICGGGLGLRWARWRGGF